MKDEIMLMQRLFNKFGLTDPLGLDIQVYALRQKRKNLNAVLRKLGIHSVMYSAVLYVFFLFKKMGFGLSVAQSAAVLFVAASVTVAGVMTGGIISVKKMIIDKMIMREDSGDAALGKSIYCRGEAGRVRNINVDAENVNSIIFTGFSGRGVDKELVDRISGVITAQVIQAKGGGFINPDAVFALTGSVEKLGDLYLLSVRLINRTNRRIIYAASEEAGTPEELMQAAKKISQDLSGKL